MMTRSRASRSPIPVTIRRRLRLLLTVGILLGLASTASCTREEVLAFIDEHPHVVLALAASGPGAPPAGTTEAGWAALRRCESSDVPTKASSSGKYLGLYQFDQTTWNGVAKSIDPAWVGKAPNTAPREVQTRLAYALYASRGSSPWPQCGRHL